jgi:pimeloyl-ACP methyl ester carboxylesterase
VWRRLVPTFAEHYTVHVYDLLGYGQSEKAETVSLDVQSRVLAELLAHWQLDNPRIVGHDFGGATTLRAHLLEKRDFEQIVLVDAVAVAPWGSPFVQHVRRHRAAFDDMPAYIHEAIIAAYVQDAAHKPLSADALAAYTAPWLGEIGQPAFYRQIAQMDQAYTDEIEPRYSSITRPVHIIWGESDGWLPLERGQKLHSLIPGSTFQTITDAGHLIQEDTPDDLLAILKEKLLS